MSAGQRQSLFRGRSREYPITSTLQKIGDELEILGMILDHEDDFLHRGRHAVFLLSFISE
jgi:hypothetical protein